MKRRYLNVLPVFAIICSTVSIVTALETARTRNVAVFPLNSAKKFTKDFIFGKFFPNFDKNYALLQEKCKAAKDIPRIDMPVINSDDIPEFQRKITNGFIDVLPPYSDKHEKKPKTGEFIYFPKDLKADERGRLWLKLGKEDGAIDDDKVFARIEYIAVKDLLPVQSQIWLEVINNDIVRWGLPKEGSESLEMTIIVSREGYILDGHHRWSKALLVDPNLKIRTLKIDLDINTLLKMGRSYGNAIGNEQNL